MIDKKEIVSWFKELESYKRIDAMYTLIGMCLPFELRFLGSVLEELGRRDSQELRGIELRVNNPQELAADIASCQNGEPTDKKIRRKMAIYLALIRACSRSCVNELFKTLEGWGDMDLVKFGDVENTLGELLLVYTMASLHPVFSFDQRNKCADILARIEECQKLLHRSQQQHQTAQQEQPSTTTTAAAATPMGQGHILTGHQHIHAPMQVLPPNYHYTVQQPPMAQMMHADATVSHPMSVDGIPLIHTNLGIPTEYTVGPAPPGTLWAVRPSVQAHAPQQPPSIDVCYVLQPHLPQSPSPMLSQQSSPSQSRTASPSRSTTSGGNTLMQQSQQQQQQQQHSRNTQQQQQSQRNNTLRNSRRPSAETTPPPAPQTMQQQQQQQQQQQPPHQLQSSQLIITDMIPSHIKNLDDVSRKNEGKNFRKKF